MLLGVFTGLQWYGPGMSAGVLPGSGEFACGVGGVGRFGGNLAGAGQVISAHVTGLKHQPAVIHGVGAVSAAQPFAMARLLCDVQIGSRPSAEDVAWAVLDSSEIEGGLTVRQALKLMAAALAGRISGADTTTVRIRSAVADDVERITATVDEHGNRTAIAVDLG